MESSDDSLRRAARRRGLPTGAMVQSDRPCERCGYNLIGLPLAGRCVECGTPISDFASASSTEDVLAKPRRPRAAKPTEYPLPVLRRLAWGTTLMAVGGGMVGGAFLAGWASAWPQAWGTVGLQPRVALAAVLLVGVPGSVIFWLGAVQTFVGVEAATLAEALRVDPLAGSSERLRTAALAAAGVIPLLCGMLGSGLALRALGEPASGMVLWAAWLAALALGAAIPPISLMLSQLAFREGNDAAMHGFEQGSWLAPLGVWGGCLLALAGGALGDWVGQALLAGATALAVYAIGVFLAAAFSLAASCRWALTNRRTAIAMDERFAERSRERAARTLR